MNATPPAPVPAQDYAELCVTTNFTFLTGASHPEELIMRAAELGLSAIAITDHNSLAGVVRAWSALKELGRDTPEAVRIRSQYQTDASSRQETGQGAALTAPGVLHLPRLIVGCRLVLEDGQVDWLALPRDRAAYQRLTRLLTVGKQRAEKSGCILHTRDMIPACKGMTLIALPRTDSGRYGAALYPAAQQSGAGSPLWRSARRGNGAHAGCAFVSGTGHADRRGRGGLLR